MIAPCRACGGAIGLMANSGGGFGYGEATTGVFVNIDMLPLECNFVFVRIPLCLDSERVDVTNLCPLNVGIITTRHHCLCVVLST